jgi:hypothetical protein
MSYCLTSVGKRRKSVSSNVSNSVGNIFVFQEANFVSAINWQCFQMWAEEVGQAISELSRELPTNEIALFSIVLSAEFGQ